jgi:hypothetical protein
VLFKLVRDFFVRKLLLFYVFAALFLVLRYGLVDLIDFGGRCCLLRFEFFVFLGLAFLGGLDLLDSVVLLLLSCFGFLPDFIDAEVGLPELCVMFFVLFVVPLEFLVVLIMLLVIFVILFVLLVELLVVFVMLFVMLVKSGVSCRVAVFRWRSFV